MKEIDNFVEEKIENLNKLNFENMYKDEGIYKIKNKSFNPLNGSKSFLY